MNDFRKLRNVARFVQLIVIRETVMWKRVIAYSFRNRPSIDPRGTPTFKDAGAEETPLTDTTRVRSEKFDWNQDRAVPEMPKIRWSLESRMEWSVVSNVADRSSRESRKMWLTSRAAGESTILRRVVFHLDVYSYGHIDPVSFILMCTSCGHVGPVSFILTCTHVAMSSLSPPPWCVLIWPCRPCHYFLFVCKHLVMPFGYLYPATFILTCTHLIMSTLPHPSWRVLM